MADAHQIVIVTGGGSGIGKASCLAFAEIGAIVVVANRTLSKAEAVAESINNSGGEALALQVDVSQSDDVKRMIDNTIGQYGRIDVLFNNAGISPSGSITEITEVEWDECLNIDLKSIFLASKYTIPHMQQQGGRCHFKYSRDIWDAGSKRQSGILYSQSRCD